METNASVSKQARLRGGMAWILSFLLCLFLTVLSLLSLLECTLLSPGFLKKQVDKSAYTAHVIEDMEDIFVSYGISSDFDEAFFTSVLTEEEVRADIYAEIDRLYAADATGADYGAFESQLYDKLTANVKERNLEITESVDQALHYLAQMCAETYREGLAFPLRPMPPAPWRRPKRRCSSASRPWRFFRCLFWAFCSPYRKRTAFSATRFMRAAGPR